MLGFVKAQIPLEFIRFAFQTTLTSRCTRVQLRDSIRLIQSIFPLPFLLWRVKNGTDRAKRNK